MRSSETVEPEQQREPGLGSKWRLDPRPGSKAADPGEVGEAKVHLQLVLIRRTCRPDPGSVLAEQCGFALNG